MGRKITISINFDLYFNHLNLSISIGPGMQIFFLIIININDLSLSSIIFTNEAFSNSNTKKLTWIKILAAKGRLPSCCKPLYGPQSIVKTAPALKCICFHTTMNMCN